MAYQLKPQSSQSSQILTLAYRAESSSTPSVDLFDLLASLYHTSPLNIEQVQVVEVPERQNVCVVDSAHCIVLTVQNYGAPCWHYLLRR